MGTSVQNLRFVRPSVKCREVTHQKSCLRILHQRIWKRQGLPSTSMISRVKLEWICFYLGDVLRGLNLSPTLKKIEELGGAKKKGEKFIKLEEFYPIYSEMKKAIKDMG